MGLAIISKGKPPCVLLLHFKCDMPRCSADQKFVAEAAGEPKEGFIELHAEAMRAGWLERFRDRGDPEMRMFLCPSCSGKEPKNGKDSA